MPIHTEQKKRNNSDIPKFIILNMKSHLKGIDNCTNINYESTKKISNRLNKRFGRFSPVTVMKNFGNIP